MPAMLGFVPGFRRRVSGFFIGVFLFTLPLSLAQNLVESPPKNPSLDPRFCPFLLRPDGFDIVHSQGEMTADQKLSRFSAEVSPILFLLGTQTLGILRIIATSSTSFEDFSRSLDAVIEREPDWLPVEVATILKSTVFWLSFNPKDPGHLLWPIPNLRQVFEAALDQREAFDRQFARRSPDWHRHYSSWLIQLKISLTTQLRELIEISKQIQWELLASPDVHHQQITSSIASSHALTALLFIAAGLTGDLLVTHYAVEPLATHLGSLDPTPMKGFTFVLGLLGIAQGTKLLLLPAQREMKLLRVAQMERILEQELPAQPSQDERFFSDHIEFWRRSNEIQKTVFEDLARNLEKVKTSLDGFKGRWMSQKKRESLYHLARLQTFRFKIDWLLKRLAALQALNKSP